MRGGITFSASNDWGGSTTTSTDVSESYSSTITVPGSTDAVDHGADEIHFLVGPAIDMTITPAYGTKPQKVAWVFSANQPASTYAYFVYVSELLNPSAMPADVKAFLDSRGITQDYYGELLKADPFAGGAPPNPSLDPARFVFVNSYAFTPPPPGVRPTSYRDNLTRNVSNNTSQDTSVSVSTGLALSGDTSFFGLFGISLKVSNTFTWSHSSSSKTSTVSNQADVITIGQPASSYSGPTVLRVYEDKIWKTYFFSLDYI